MDTKRDVATAVAGGLAVVDSTVGWIGPHRSTVTVGFHDDVADPYQKPLISGASTSSFFFLSFFFFLFLSFSFFFFLFLSFFFFLEGIYFERNV